MLEIAGGILIAVLVLYFIQEIFGLLVLGLILGLLLGVGSALYFLAIYLYERVGFDIVLLFLTVLSLVVVLFLLEFLLEKNPLRRQSKYEQNRTSYIDSE